MFLRIPSILHWSLLLGIVALGGCQAQKAETSQPVLRAVVDPTSAVLVLPSRQQQLLAEETGIHGLWAGVGRNNGLLGGQPNGFSGPSVAIRESNDRQRIVNGRVRSNVLLETRARTIRSR